MSLLCDEFVLHYNRQASCDHYLQCLLLLLDHNHVHTQRCLLLLANCYLPFYQQMGGVHLHHSGEGVCA
jgi:hypothetical protein